MGGFSEGSEDVGESESVYEKIFWELDSDVFGVCGIDVLDVFVDFELVDGREKGDCCVEGCVVEDFFWDLVFYEVFWRLFCFVVFGVCWVGKFYVLF